LVLVTVFLVVFVVVWVVVVTVVVVWFVPGAAMARPEAANAARPTASPFARRVDIRLILSRRTRTTCSASTPTAFPTLA
jgi:flagellar basal body-associated protein FliL